MGREIAEAAEGVRKYPWGTSWCKCNCDLECGISDRYRAVRNRFLARAVQEESCTKSGFNRG